MKIIFNAYNLILGGGLSVGTGIVEGLFTLNSADEIHVFLPKRKQYTYASVRNIHIHFIPRFFTDYTLGRLLANIYLSICVRILKPDRVFSLGNYALSVNCPQLLLLQWPYAVYPEKVIWSRMSWADFFKRKIRLFFLKRSLRFANALTVQTEVMKARVRKYLPKYKGDVFVLESSFNKSKGCSDPYISSLRKRPEEKLLLFMSEYYSHKNLEILIPLSELIKKRNLPYRILITINSSTGKAPALIGEISKRNLGEIVINLGRLDQNQTLNAYNSCDALILPTLVESYGLTYLEAAYARIPVITSDLDFAHSLNGQDAWYFNPLSPQDILHTIEIVFSEKNKNFLEEKINRAFEKTNMVRSWQEITEEYIRLLKNL